MYCVELGIHAARKAQGYSAWCVRRGGVYLLSVFWKDKLIYQDQTQWFPSADLLAEAAIARHMVGTLMWMAPEPPVTSLSELMERE